MSAAQFFLRRSLGVAMAGLGTATTIQYQRVVSKEKQLPQQSLVVFQDEENINRNTKTTTSKQQQQQQQKVIVIGAGVVGVSTAYKLAKLGHQVAVLEPMSEPGEECSNCAAGGMSRQNVVVDKNTWIAVLKCILPKSLSRIMFGGIQQEKEEEFQFFHINWLKSISDPFFLRWAITFTKTSLVLPMYDSFGMEKKRNDMLEFTNYAVTDMVDNFFENPKDDMSTKAGYNSRGSLALSYDEAKKKKNPKQATSQTTEVEEEEEEEVEDELRRTKTTKLVDRSTGKLKFLRNTVEPNLHLDTTGDILKEESSLKFQNHLPSSAKYEYETKSASCGRFTKELAKRCEHLGVQFLYDTKVKGISTTPATTAAAASNQQQQKSRISEIRTNRGIIQVPDGAHIVVAAGAWTPHVLALMDLYAPVYPLKGYALSVSAKQALKENPSLQNQDLPSRIVCDKFVYTTRLGDEIRFTSIGEFSEWDTKPTPHVDNDFRKEAIRQFPQLENWIVKAKTYCGHRPYVNDGILLLGATDTHQNLYVSCGPGSNGWKLAIGSGDIIARLISGQTPGQIQSDLGFDVLSFSPAGRVLNAPIFAKICRARWNV